MSFILDALKKLEREKESARPGVVMVGPVSWGGSDRRSHRRRLVAAAASLVAVVAVGAWWLTSGATPPAPPEEAPAPPPASRATPQSTAPASRVEPPPARAVAPPALATDDLLHEEPSKIEEPPATPAPTVVAAPSSPSLASLEPVNPDDELLDTEAEAVPLEDTPIVADDETPQPEYRLTAISERDGEPIALLNDRLIHEGDRFGDIRVLRIGETEVEIEVKGERKVIGF